MVFLKNTYNEIIDESALLVQYRQGGDLTILGSLFQQYMDLVYGVCLQYLKDTELAKDSVMLIFEELIEKLRKHEVNNFKAWLHRVAVNHCLMRLRAAKNSKIVAFSLDFMQNGQEMHHEEAIEKEAQLNKMEDCLNTLPDQQQKMVRLFYLEEKSYNEIVTVTGIEWAHVRSSIQNGRRNLKICMEKQTSFNKQA